MKKLFVLLSAIAFACSVSAQTGTNQATPMQTAPSGTPMTHPQMKDMFMMRGGKMMMFKSGKMQPMDKEMTLNNGDKVMTDGTIMKKDGTKVTMKDGDRVDMEGKVMSRRMPGAGQPMQQTQPMQQAQPK